MILDHIVDYDYERVNRGGENLLDYAKILKVQPSVITKIEEKSDEYSARKQN